MKVKCVIEGSSEQRLMPLLLALLLLCRCTSRIGLRLCYLLVVAAGRLCGSGHSRLKSAGAFAPRVSAGSVAVCVTSIQPRVHEAGLSLAVQVPYVFTTLFILRY